ncbi:hypothetical protein BASA81_012641 [Batrachochytrium salamandrivorans]|nr:hypothetical protein BASA81_012641 [Batrachochytrium salamandrivorans]
MLLFVSLVGLLGAKAVLLSGRGQSFCSIQPDRQVYCFGLNEYGSLGLESFENPSVPTRMLDVANATDVSNGARHVCIVDSLRARCAGDNTVGQLGDDYGQLGNNDLAQSSPVAHGVFGFELQGAVDLTVGYVHTCVVTKRTGQVQCTGGNNYGQLGVGPASLLEWTMTLVPGLDGVSAVSAGDFHTCAIRALTGSVYCWGDNYFGALGVGSEQGISHLPLPVIGLMDAVKVFCGDLATFVVLRNGTARRFGYTWNIGANASYNYVPVPFATLGVEEIQGGATVCVQKAKGALECIGADAYGQLGNGSPLQREASVWNSTASITLATKRPAGRPTKPTKRPTQRPTSRPSKIPTLRPTSEAPTKRPTTLALTKRPTLEPTSRPSKAPTLAPTSIPSKAPTLKPSKRPTEAPTTRPSQSPTLEPTKRPTKVPTLEPTRLPTEAPTTRPSKAPTLEPTKRPTLAPTTRPSKSPTLAPTTRPSKSPTLEPTKRPTKAPTTRPSKSPTLAPTKRPTKAPTDKPTKRPTLEPTARPSKSPTLEPTKRPTKVPTNKPTKPTQRPTRHPTTKPTQSPTLLPTHSPTSRPSASPTFQPTIKPTKLPTNKPTRPTKRPTKYPTNKPAKLRDNHLGNKGLAILAQALKESPNNTLRTLSFAGNGIGNQGLQLIAQALKHEHCALRELDLCGSSKLAPPDSLSPPLINAHSLLDNDLGDESLKIVDDAVQSSKRRGAPTFTTPEQRRLAELENQLADLTKQLADERTSAALAEEEASRVSKVQIHTLVLLREEDRAELDQLQQRLLQGQSQAEAMEATRSELVSEIQTWQATSEAGRLRALAAESALASSKLEISTLQDLVANGAVDLALQQARANTAEQQLQLALEEHLSELGREQGLNAALQAQLASLTAQLAQERSIAESASQSVLRLTLQLGKAHRAFSELQTLRVRDIKYLLILVAGLVAAFWAATSSIR